MAGPGGGVGGYMQVMMLQEGVEPGAPRAGPGESEETIEDGKQASQEGDGWARKETTLQPRSSLPKVLRSRFLLATTQDKTYLRFELEGN